LFSYGQIEPEFLLPVNISFYNGIALTTDHNRPNGSNQIGATFVFEGTNFVGGAHGNERRLTTAPWLDGFVLIALLF
jgi:hypothetical protein